MGKTVMALAQARQLTDGRDGIKAQRVALICYLWGPAAHLRRVTAAWGRKDRPAFVGRFEELALQWGVRTYEQVLAQWHGPATPPTVTDYYERLLPEEMARVAADVPEGQRFDAVVVDEAQDFADTWWPVAGGRCATSRTVASTPSPTNAAGVLPVRRPPLPLVPLMLDHNLRNTQPIANSSTRWHPIGCACSEGRGRRCVRRVQRRRGAGPGATTRWTPCSAPGGPRDVALLTSGPATSSETAAETTPRLLGSFWDDDMTFYGHVLGCKGLERRAVVLCVNKDQVQPRDRERLYVGLSGDRPPRRGRGPRLHRARGRAEVAARLGLPSSA